MPVNIFLPSQLKNKRGIGQAFFDHLEMGDLLFLAVEIAGNVFHDFAMSILYVIMVKLPQLIQGIKLKYGIGRINFYLHRRQIPDMVGKDLLPDGLIITAGLMVFIEKFDHGCGKIVIPVSMPQHDITCVSAFFHPGDIHLGIRQQIPFIGSCRHRHRGIKAPVNIFLKRILFEIVVG